MLILIDTNIWRSHFALNTASGSALRLFLSESSSTLVVPEVVRLETEQLFKRELEKWVRTIGDHYRQLLTVFGHLKAVVLPSEEQIAAKVGSVIADTGIPIRPVAFTKEVAWRALQRVIDHTPPSYPHRQEFKDCVIWEHCLDLLEEDDVFLLTSDGGFFRDQAKKVSDSLPEAMDHECRAKPHRLRLSQDLADLLAIIRTRIEIDASGFPAAYLNESRSSSLARLLDQNGFQRVGEPTINIRLFATEQPDTLYVEFEIIYACEDLTEGRKQAQVALKGTGMFKRSTGELADIRPIEEELVYPDLNGDMQRKATVYLNVGPIIMGHETKKYVVREPL